MCFNWIRWHTNIASFASCKCSLLEHYLPRKNQVGWWLMIKRPYISIDQQLWNQNFPSNNHFNIGCLLWFLILVLMLFSFTLFSYSLLFSFLQCSVILSYFCMSFCLVILSCFCVCIIWLFLLFSYIVFFCSSTLHSSCSSLHVLCCSNYPHYFWLCICLYLPFALCCKWSLKECGIVALNIHFLFLFLKSCIFFH
jgi:hypothetical protein